MPIGLIPEVNEIWVSGAWEWRVLKKYKAPESEARDPYARWHCAVSSPYTFGAHELGDVYVREITTGKDGVAMKSKFPGGGDAIAARV